MSKRGQYAASDCVTRGLKVSDTASKPMSQRSDPTPACLLKHDAIEFKGASRLVAGLCTLNLCHRERLAQ